MADLSPRQTDALQEIREYRNTHGYAPSVRELAAAMNVSIHAADGHIRALVRKGAIHREPNVARGITIPTTEG